MGEGKKNEGKTMNLLKATITLVGSIFSYVVTYLYWLKDTNPLLLALIIGGVGAILNSLWEESEEEWGKRKSWRKYRG